MRMQMSESIGPDADPPFPLPAPSYEVSVRSKEQSPAVGYMCDGGNVDQNLDLILRSSSSVRTRKRLQSVAQSNGLDWSRVIAWNVSADWSSSGEQAELMHYEELFSSLK